MGEHRRKLIQNYEDAKLALLLDEYTEVYGKISTEQYEKDLADGKIKKISDQEAVAELNEILRRAEEEEAKESRISTRFKGATRKIATVAASIAIFFALMVTVQAAGVDVFGAVGKWTDNLFHFESDSTIEELPEEKTLMPVTAIKETLSTHGFPSELSPLWFPDSFDVSEINFMSNNEAKSVFAMLENKDNEWIMLRIDCFTSGQSTDNLWYQKDAVDVETIDADQKTFYLTQNNGIWEAMMYDNGFSVSIIDSQGKEALIQIIYSYGG